MAVAGVGRNVSVLLGNVLLCRTRLKHGVHNLISDNRERNRNEFVIDPYAIRVMSLVKIPRYA